MLKSSRVSWVFVIVATLVLTCLFTLVSMGRADAPSFHILHNRQTVTWLTWLLFAPAIFIAARRFPFGEGSQLKWLGRHLVIGAAFSIAGLALAEAVSKGMSGAGHAMQGTSMEQPPIVSSLAVGILLYILIAVSYQAVTYHSAAREREAVATRLRADLAEARLATLEGQLHPHFLFNSLNSIAALMRIDPSQAEVMLEQLSELLRATLRANPMQLVPLRDAVHIAEQYLAIERIRFAERLTTSISLSDEARLAMVPQLLLQPLVENAVRHGIAPLERGGAIAISASVEATTLRIRIEDNGIGVGNSPPERAGTGLGLRTVKSLVSHLYGDAGTVDVTAGAMSGTVVSVAMPYRTDANTSQNTQ